jgi:hypothetical protein
VTNRVRIPTDGVIVDAVLRAPPSAPALIVASNAAFIRLDAAAVA